MKKLKKFLIILIIVGIFIIITLSRYIENEGDIPRKIGNVWTGGQISTYNYAAIVKNFEYFVSFIEKDDYENAYKFVPYEYKMYKSFDDFHKIIENINFEDIQVTSIIKRTERVYSVMFLSNDNNKEHEFLMTFNKENTSYNITPETFIEYREYDEKLKKGKVTYELISSVNYIDKYVSNIRITNNSKNDYAIISNIELIQNNTKHINGNFNRIELSPGEVKDISIEFETYIDFPNKIEISRKFDKNNTEEKYILIIEE